MPVLQSVNYLVKYRNGDLVLFTDTFEESIRPIRLVCIYHKNDHMTPTFCTLTDMTNGINHARNNGNDIYVFEEWE